MSALSKARSNNVKNMFGNVSWAKRPKEPLNEYSVFCLYLTHPEPRVTTWIETISKSEEKSELPNGFKDAEIIRAAAIKWRWEIRKNDYVNEMYAIARKLDDAEIVSMGTMLHDTAKKIAFLCASSVDKALAEDEKIPVDKIMDFLVKLNELKILQDDIEERRKERISMNNVPTEKLRELLSQIKKKDE